MWILRMEKYILDICCGPKMMWFEKNQQNTIYLDQRLEKRGYNPSRQNRCIIPDIIADFKHLPFPDETFRLVVMDPPHIHSSGDLFKITMDYGKLDKYTWQEDIRRGVNEGFRVLKDEGILIFKWNETQIKKKDVLRAIRRKPLFGHPVLSKVPTHWFTFMKLPHNKSLNPTCGAVRE